MATIWVQEWKSNDPTEVMIITHNKLVFTTGFHKRSSQIQSANWSVLARNSVNLQDLGSFSTVVQHTQHDWSVLHWQTPPSSFTHQKISSRWKSTQWCHRRHSFPAQPQTAHSPMSPPLSHHKDSPGWKVKLAKRLLTQVFCCFGLGWHCLPHHQSNRNSWLKVSCRNKG